MKRNALLVLALAGCRTAAELGPSLPPIRGPSELAGHLASRARDADNISARCRMKYSGPAGSRRRRAAGIEVVMFLGEEGRARLRASYFNRTLLDLLVAENEFWAHVPEQKKLFHGTTEGVVPKGKGRPGLPLNVGGKWFLFPDLSLASDETMTVSRGRRHYEVAVTKGGRPARTLKVCSRSRTPEEITVYDLARPGEVLATLRYTRFRLDGKTLLPQRLEIELPAPGARVALTVDKLNLHARPKRQIWLPPRVPKATELIERGSGGRDG